MRRFFFEKENIIDNQITISNEQVNHIKNVLRLGCGDEIVCFCGNGMDYLCKILTLNNKTCVCCEILNKKENFLSKPKITVFQGLPKGDKLEFIVQKLTELGVNNFVPFENKFTIAKPNAGKIERLNKIVIEACKQCGRTELMNIGKTENIKQICNEIQSFSTVILCYENEKSCHIADAEIYGDNIAIIIGSEGGFADEEVSMLVKSGAKCVTLGENILRTETASVCSASYLIFSQRSKK